jgi:uncharacterized protein (DUF433 family)
MLSEKEFLDAQADDELNPSLTYQEYIEIERRLADKAERERREFYGNDYLQDRWEEAPELTSEDETALDRAWAAVAAEKAAADTEPRPQQVELGQHIVSDPEICGGDLTFKGTRILVKDVLDTVAKGWDWDKISEAWDGRISREAIAEAVALANEALAEKNEQRWLQAA